MQITCESCGESFNKKPKDINRMKSDFNETYFIEMCDKISLCRGGTRDI